MGIAKLFEEEKYADVTRHSWTLVKKELQEKYNNYSISYKIKNMLMPFLFGIFRYSVYSFSTLAIAYYIVAILNWPVVNIIPMRVALPVGIFLVSFLVLINSRDEYARLSKSEGPERVSFLFYYYLAPASVVRAIFWAILIRKSKKMDIQVLGWVLILLEAFKNPMDKTSNKKNKDSHNYQLASFGYVICDLAEEEERVRNGGDLPNEYTMQYILQNIRLMLNSLYSDQITS